MSTYLGYLASALVLCTFCMKTMMPLRIVALASNVAFIAYAALLHLYPILILHTILFPLNAWRLSQIFRLVNRVRGTIDDSQIFRALVPFAKRMTVRRGGVVMRKGDASDALYLVVEGSLWVEQAEVELGQGSIVGEIGVLSRGNLRTATVVAKTDCVLGRVSADEFERVYFTSPSLGLSLVRLIIGRLTRELEARRLNAVEA